MVLSSLFLPGRVFLALCEDSKDRGTIVAQGGGKVTYSYSFFNFNRWVRFTCACNQVKDLVATTLLLAIVAWFTQSAKTIAKFLCPVLTTTVELFFFWCPAHFPFFKFKLLFLPLLLEQHSSSIWASVWVVLDSNLAWPFILIVVIQFWDLYLWLTHLMPFNLDIASGPVYTIPKCTLLSIYTTLIGSSNSTSKGSSH